MCCALLDMRERQGVFDATAVTALLSAICCAALTKWLDDSGQHVDSTNNDVAALPSLLFCILSTFLPDFLTFIPLLAFEAQRITGKHFTESWNKYTHWCWTLPLMRSYWTYRSVVNPAESNSVGTSATAALSAAIIVSFSCIAALLGHVLTVSDSEHRSLLDLNDVARIATRRSATQVDSLHEQREESIRTATLQERTRIAREIHDNVGHILTRALMQTQAASVVARASADDIAAKALSDISASLDEAVTMVRRSVHNLDDDGTDFETQITDAAHAMDAAKQDFTVSLDCSIKDAPAPVTRCITAVIREALTNVIRHSTSTEATVTLHDYPAFWQLAIFNKTTIKPVPRISPHADQPLRGMGLADIQQRIESLGGTSICGPYHDGWRVFASLPKSPWTSRETNKETTAGIDTEVTV